MLPCAYRASIGSPLCTSSLVSVNDGTRRQQLVRVRGDRSFQGHGDASFRCAEIPAPSYPATARLDDRKYALTDCGFAELRLSSGNVPQGDIVAGIWRDFVVAVVTALRRRDEQAIADERRRAVERLAEETIRQERRTTDPPE